jgi:hypothetical protein
MWGVYVCVCVVRVCVCGACVRMCVVCACVYVCSVCVRACICVVRACVVCILALCMRRIIHALSSVPCPAAPHFAILSLKRHDVQKTVTEHKICFYFIYNFSHSKRNSVRYYQQMYI